MFVKKEPEKLSSPFKLVMYDTDASGKCVPTYVPSEYSADIDVYYAQRALELERLLKALMDGRISPVGLFVKYQHMDIKDVAKRVGLRGRLVEKHLTPEGFKGATVEMLMRYARVFDLAVSDFFEFTEMSDDVDVACTRHHDRLINRIVLSGKTK